MKKIVAILMAMLLVMSVTVVLAGNAKDTQTDSKKVKVIIGFKEKPNQNDENMIRGLGGETRHTYNIIDAKAVEIPEQAIDRIKKNPRVAYVEEDGEVHALDTELDNSWGVTRIGAGIVHDGGNTGAGVKVAIIDSGIDYTHSDLNDNYVGGIDYVNGDEDPMDDAGHGTHCAGIVAAEDNDEGVVGVAPGAKLYAVKVLDATGRGYVSDVIAGIDWSVAEDMQIISLSLGGGDLESMEAACDAAYGAGIVVVASAGNSGNPPGRGDNVGYPAAYSSVIAVAATDSNDERARWSSTGPDVELAAPGVSIYSTVPDGYATYSGTSMACPHVAGTAALVIASNSSLTNMDVRQRLQETADDLGAPDWYGYGLVDADEAALPTGNQPPIADAGSDQTVNDDDGNSVEEVTLNGSESYDPDGTSLSYEWTENNEPLSTEPSFTYNFNVGNHPVTLTVTDNDGATDSDDVIITVTEASAIPEMHIASIDMSTKITGINTNAIATVTIFDADNCPVEGATVSGTWSGLTSDRDAGTTDATGEVALSSDRVKRASGTFTFTVDGVTHADLTWDGKSASDSITVP